jgi:hypothetical protein
VARMSMKPPPADTSTPCRSSGGRSGDLDGGGVEGEEIAKLGFQFEAAAQRLTVVVVLAFLRMDRKARLRTVGVALHRIAERNHDGSWR